MYVYFLCTMLYYHTWNHLSPDNVNENENGVFCRHLNRWNELSESIASFDSKNPLSNFLQR